MVGNTQVGKTSILTQYSKKSFNENALSTTGVDFVTVRYRAKSGQLCRIKIWDTCGQERYKSLVRSYFRTSDGVIVAFDLTNLKSFKDVQDWLGHA